MMTDEGNSDRAVLRHGGDVIFMVKWRVPAGALALRRLSQCRNEGEGVKVCGKW